MANYKISQLPSSSALTSDDFLPIVDSGTLTTQRATAQQVLDYITGSTFNRLNVTNLTASNITASNIRVYEQRVDDVLNTNFLRVSGTSLTTDVYQDTSTRFVVDTNAQYFQFFKLATPVTAGFGNATTAITKVDGINIEVGNASSTVKVAGYLTGSTAKFTTISSSNSIVSGNLVLEGQVDFSAYPDYAYIIYTSSYDKLVIFPGLYVSGNLTASGDSSFQTVSASNINISGNIQFLQRAVIRNIASSSGDYFGASTLELIPDIDLSGSGQYLVIDPTSPNHIHIRAGGLIDSASAQLIVGGEKSNIIVRNLDNSFSEKHWVQITTTENISSASFIWDFGNDGILTLPGTITGSTAEFSQVTGNVSFTAADSALWAVSPPITIQDAINRLAAAIYSGSSGSIA